MAYTGRPNAGQQANSARDATTPPTDLLGAIITAGLLIPYTRSRFQGVPHG